MLKNAQNSFFAGTLPRTPLEKLTTHAQTSSQLGRGYPVPTPSTPATSHPELGGNLLHGLRGI